MDQPQNTSLDLSTAPLWTSAPLQLQEELWLPTEPAALFAYVADHARIGEWFPLVRRSD